MPAARLAAASNQRESIAQGGYAPRPSKPPAHFFVTSGHPARSALMGTYLRDTTLATSPTAAETARRFDFRLQPTIPLNLATARLPKLAAFYKHHGSMLAG